ncbi:MAG: carbohydrate ABC transporter permease [Aggregatilineales bacterium]
MINKHTLKYWLGRVGFSALVILIFLYTAFPFYWALISALKPERELIQTPATFFPQTITFQNFEAVFRNDSFLRGLLNSSVVSVVVVVSALAIGSFAAYALGRLKFSGKRWILYVILSMTLFPQISVLPGLFTLVNQLGMYGSITSLMTTYLIFTLPFTVWVLTSFFRALPAELEQGPVGYLSTHPPSPELIANAERAAAGK